MSKEFLEALPLGNRIKGEETLASPEPDVAVIVPGIDGARDAEQVISEVLLKRKQALVSKSVASKLKLWQPSRDIRSVLNDLDFTMSDKAEPGRIGAGKNGSYYFLNSLNAAIVFSLPTAITRDQISDQLKGEFEVVRNFPLSLPPRKNLSRQPAAKPERSPWPEVTGISQSVRGKKGAGIRIGILDTGIDSDHSEFDGYRIEFSHIPHGANTPPDGNIFRESPRRGFDSDGHGTHVASVLSGRTTGIATSARLLVASVCDKDDNRSSIRRIVMGLDWMFSRIIADEHAGRPFILNMSFGYPPAIQTDANNGDVDEKHISEKEEYRRETQAFQRLLDFVFDANTLVVASIGNDGEDRFRLPAGLKGVLSVGAADQSGEEVCAFSGNIAPHLKEKGAQGPYILGLGEEITGAIGRNIRNDHLYERRSGTSQAAAYVSGIAALYWNYNKKCSAEQIRAVIQQTALKLGDEPLHRQGAGLARFDPEAAKQL